jgi:hypothetical protein
MAHWQKPQPTSPSNLLSALVICASAMLATLALLHRHDHIGRRDGHLPPAAHAESGRLLASASPVRTVRWDR